MRPITMTIDLGSLSRSQRQKVYQAGKLLEEAGVLLRAQSNRWELGWSLWGARVKVASMVCENPSCQADLSRDVYWAAVREGNRLVDRAFCSPVCRSVTIQGLWAEEVLFEAQTGAGLG